MWVTPGRSEVKQGKDDSKHETKDSRQDDIAFGESSPSRQWNLREWLDSSVQETNLGLHGMLFTSHQRFWLAREPRIGKPFPPTVERHFSVNGGVRSR